MINECLISVIVPIHGVEKYLKKCLDSLVHQDTNFLYEILCLDDSSIDSSGQIIEEFKTNYSQKIIHITCDYGNVSLTRNKGLEFSNGRYITFVDGDDFVSKDYLQSLYDSLITTGADISVCNYYNFKNCKKTRNITSFFASNGTFSSQKALKRLSSDVYCRGFVWGKLFSKSIIEKYNIKFLDVKKIVEDSLFCYMTFAHTNKVSFVKKRLYFYRLRNDSITSSTSNLASAQKVLNLCAIYKLYCIDIFNSDWKKYYIISKFSKKFLIYYYIFTSSITLKEIYHNVKKANSQFKIIFNNISIKNKPWSSLCDDLMIIKSQSDNDDLINDLY